MGKAEKCLDRPQVVGAGNTPFKDVKAVLGYEFKLFLIHYRQIDRQTVTILCTVISNGIKEKHL